jgi:hypothetical protein
MQTESDLARIVRSWLRTDEHEAADRVLDNVLGLLDATPQRPAWWPARRVTDVNTQIRIAVVAAAVVVVAVIAINVLPRIGGVGGTATPAPSAGSPPLGTYELKDQTHLSGVQQAERLTLLAGGQYRQSIAGLDITGTWTASQGRGEPGQLTFRETAGGQCSPPSSSPSSTEFSPGNVPGTYSWSYAGTDLTLTLVKDDCEVRPADFSAVGPWVLQP